MTQTTWIIAPWWIIALLGLVWINIALWGLVGDHVAQARGLDRVRGLKAGLLGGPIGVAILATKNPDSDEAIDYADIIDVTCPHCDTEQDASASSTSFTCWRCQRVTTIRG